MSQGNAIFAFVLGFTILSQSGCCCCVVPVGSQPGQGGQGEFEEFFDSEPSPEGDATFEDEPSRRDDSPNAVDPLLDTTRVENREERLGADE